MQRWLGIPFIVAACAAPETSGWRGTVVDSAGVTVVHNAGHEWSGPETWTVEPLLSIGEEAGDDRYIFGRIADATMDAAGRILVLDQHAHVVRIYDSDGRFVRNVGRAGRGPGEFSDFVNAIMIGSGDSLFVADYPQARIHVFSNTGDFVRAVSLPPLPNGHSWALSRTRGFYYRGMTISRNQQNRFEFWDAILALPFSASSPDTVVVFDYGRTDIGGPGNIRVPLIVNSPFWDALPSDMLAWSATDKREILVHTGSGVLQMIIRHDAWVRRPIENSDRDQMRDLLRRKMEMLGGDVSIADGPSVATGDFFPSITGIKSGPQNTIWVQRMGDVNDIDPWGINAPNRAEWLGGPLWDVLDGDGRALGVVRLPDRYRMIRMVGHTMIGVHKDDLDVERVLLLQIRDSNTPTS